MKAILKFLIALLLLFNGIGAIYGGGNLILHPDGSSMQLSLSLLQHSPFSNYFIPGIILFVVNGLLSIYTFLLLILHRKNYVWLAIIQGVILLGWIIIQILLLRIIYFLHIILGAVGLLLIILGILAKKSKMK